MELTNNFIQYKHTTAHRRRWPVHLGFQEILALLDNNDEEDDVEDEPFFPGSDDDCGILQEEEIDSDHEPRLVTI